MVDQAVRASPVPPQLRDNWTLGSNLSSRELAVIGGSEVREGTLLPSWAPAPVASLPIGPLKTSAVWPSVAMTARQEKEMRVGEWGGDAANLTSAECECVGPQLGADCWEVEYCGLQPLFQAGKTALPIKARVGHLTEVF